VKTTITLFVSEIDLNCAGAARPGVTVVEVSVLEGQLSQRDVSRGGAIARGRGECPRFGPLTVPVAELRQLLRQRSFALERRVACARQLVDLYHGGGVDEPCGRVATFVAGRRRRQILCHDENLRSHE